MEVERASYPKFRESAALKPHPNAHVEPTFCSLFVDEQAWNHRANGFLKGAKLYSRERFPKGRHPLFPPTAGAPYFYDTDQGSKQSLATKLLDAQFSRNHTSWGIAPRFQRPPTTCDEKVGPGSYSFPRYPTTLASPIRAATAPRFEERPVTSMDSRFGREDHDGPYNYTNSLTPALPPPGDDVSGFGGPPPAPGAGSGAGAGAGSPAGMSTRAAAYRGKPSTAPAGGGARAARARRQGPPSVASVSTAGTAVQPMLGAQRPQTRGELQGLLMQHQRQRAVMQTRRLVKRRVDRETEPLIDKAEANTMSWTRRTAFGGESIAKRGHSIPASPRFADIIRERKRAAGIPAPGQYHKPSSFLRKSIHKHDPRNDFPTRSTRGFRRGTRRSKRRTGRSRGSTRGHMGL